MDMKLVLCILIPLLLCHCGGGFGGTSVANSPAVLNVSGWDPKEVQRSGDRYNEHNLSALRRNGAVALIARSAKGPLLDDKFSSFLSSADREGLLLGAYHFVTMDRDPAAQADSFVNRVRAIARARNISHRRILLVGDFDTKSSPERLVRFIERIEQRTGVLPLVYLENSDALRASLRNATPSQKRRIRRAPYWIALYGPGGTERSMSTAGPLTPDGLMEQYGIWDQWAMWQYGGVVWSGGRSNPKHYNTSSWRSPRYFGNMAHPMERNVFRGSPGNLRAFWSRHGYQWW
jgi:GH25 family lysozyme M1 (1,4-beta-N-acetylmuramidase)